ncbi:MAG: glucosamine-6-phosphate deaminase [Planctomycetota bacterium]
MRIERPGSATELAERSADLVAGLLRRKPDARIVLPAGKTPAPVFRELVRRVGEQRLDLSDARLFQLDEMLGVSPSDGRSFHSFLRRSLLDLVPRDPARDHLLDGAATDPEHEIRAHAERLERLGGPDLVLLGIGLNGHVAFNEPGSSPDDRARVVPLSRQTRATLRTLFDDRELPSSGMTLGLHEILSARSICLLALGVSKSKVLAAVLEQEPSSALPATLLARHEGFVILADEAACSLLPGEPERNESSGA